MRDASITQINGNTEIQNIKQIIGLQHGKASRLCLHSCTFRSTGMMGHSMTTSASWQVYDSVKQLRYGHLMIMTDQDHDGSHIKGLIMNFFHHFYPSLLKIPGFLLEFITPIVKV